MILIILIIYVLIIILYKILNLDAGFKDIFNSHINLIEYLINPITNNKIIITTTQGESSIQLKDFTTSMIINKNDNLLGYVKYSSFKMSGFYLRNQNDIPEILFMKNDNWNVKMIRNNSEIRLEYILAFMGNYLFWNDSNYNGVDMCNFVNEFFRSRLSRKCRVPIRKYAVAQNQTPDDARRADCLHWSHHAERPLAPLHQKARFVAGRHRGRGPKFLTSHRSAVGQNARAVRFQNHSRGMTCDPITV